MAVPKSPAAAVAGKAAKPRASKGKAGDDKSPLSGQRMSKNVRLDSKGTRELKPGQKLGGPVPRGAAGSKLLMTEVIVCFSVLAFGTMVPAQHGRPTEGIGHLAAKGSALALLFFVLAMVASAGPGAEKAAGGIGGLVTAAYLFTSGDAYNILSWVTGFYGKPGTAATKSASFETVKYSGKLVTPPTLQVPSETTTAPAGGVMLA